MPASPHAHAAGVHAFARHEQAGGRGDVGRRIAEGTPEAPPGDDLAAERVGPAQKRRRRFDRLPTRDHLPDHRRAGGDPADEHRRDHPHVEPEPRAGGAQRRGVAGAAAPVTEVIPDDHADRPQPPVQDLLGEGVGGKLRERGIETGDHYDGGAVTVEQA
jgi:hypothetical protein